MCLVLVAVDPLADFPIVVAANRDERHDRPADALDWWADHRGILAGRDRVAGGTWFGVGADGRFATVLNDHRFPPPVDAPSRGELVPAFLASDWPGRWLDELAAGRERYAGFHLLAGSEAGVRYCARALGETMPLSPGLHVIDNAGLDVDDPRGVRARDRIGPVLGRAGALDGILERLGDSGPPGYGTGDRRPIFIQDPVFGTRCSTVLRIDASGYATCRERRFDAEGSVIGESTASWQCTRMAPAVCPD